MTALLRRRATRLARRAPDLERLVPRRPARRRRHVPWPVLVALVLTGVVLGLAALRRLAVADGAGRGASGWRDRTVPTGSEHDPTGGGVPHIAPAATERVGGTATALDPDRAIVPGAPDVPVAAVDELAALARTPRSGPDQL